MRMTFYFKLVFLLYIFLSLTLISCAPQAQYEMIDRNLSGLQIETHQLGEQIKRLQKRMDAIEQKGVKHTGPGSIARVNARMDRLESELLRLNGLIEQMQYNQERQREELQIIKERLALGPAIEKKDSIAQTARSNLDQKEKVKEEPGAVISDIEAKQGTKKIEEKPEKKIDLYEEAIGLFKQKKYKEAKGLFRDFIKTNPNSPKVANAYFWIGECEYKMSRFEEAILAYNKVISNFPKSNKVPDALLKQGFAFAKLGDKESARILLKKLTRKYPGTPQAKAAKRQLRLLR